jgi:hypothetical protein
MVRVGSDGGSGGAQWQSRKNDEDGALGEVAQRWPGTLKGRKDGSSSRVRRAQAIDKPGKSHRPRHT